MTYMFAYGSNLNLAQMARRCPDAVALCRVRLRDWRLVFRGVADCIPEEGAVVYGGLWRITPRCERALDAYEGVRHGLYSRVFVPLRFDGEQTEMLLYCMNSTGIMPPSRVYLAGIREGYRDFGMPKVARGLLAQAVRASWDEKNPSYRERQRHARTGRPPLAPRPSISA